MNPIILALKHQAEELWESAKLSESKGDKDHANNLRSLARMAAGEADSIARKSKIRHVSKRRTISDAE